jgi:hypothetical protein
MEFVGETADFPQEEILWRNQAISSVLDAVGDVRGWDVTVRNVFKWPAIPDWGQIVGFYVGSAGNNHGFAAAPIP